MHGSRRVPPQSYRRSFLFAGLAAALVFASVSNAQMYRPTPSAGGIDAVPKLACPIRSNDAAVIKWHGPPGPYTVRMVPTLNETNWSAAARVTTARQENSLVISNLSGAQGFFRLEMPANGFVGPGGCSGCHSDQYERWRKTGHGSAFDSIKNMPAVVQKDCLVCHTTGHGQPSGYVDAASSGHLQSVSCENCHGPAAAHKYGDHDIVKPIVSVASEICGGCHTDAHHPTFNEWTNSAHVHVSEDVQHYLLDPNPLVGLQRQLSCGVCHSAATRVALLNEVRARRSTTNVIAGVTNIVAGATNFLALPSGADAAEFGQTCVVCHDPHESSNVAQLRNPVFSTNFFTLPTTYVQTNVLRTNWAGVVTTNISFRNDVFASAYDPNVQVCGQCHNTRGADWNSSSRPPHHSPQYNMLIGAVQANYLNGTNVSQVIGSRFGRPLAAIHPHGENTNGCAQCHMPAVTFTEPTESSPNYTGHEFNMRLDGCTLSGCHTSTNQAWGFMLGLQAETTNNITRLVNLLGQWATNKAPAITNAFASYGKFAWEFTSAGQLSNPTGTNTFPSSTNVIVGPASSLQARIPTTIRQARFDLYMVAHDASLGVHNPEYVRYVLNHGISNVTYQLTQP